MQCDKCVLSRFKQTGKHGCMMPHCTKPLDELAKTYSQIFSKEKKDSEDLFELAMVQSEINRKLKQVGDKYSREYAPLVGVNSHEM